jgi:hypothetical protein
MWARGARGRAAGVLALVTLFPALAAAQDPPDYVELPDSIAERIVARFNDVRTTRFTGDTRIAPGTRIVGDVVVLGGSVTVAGAIDGELAVVNGDLMFERGATVTGLVTVVGGGVQGVELATLAAGISHYHEPLRFRQDRGQLVYVPPPPPAALAAGRDFRFGRTDLLIAVRDGYNRVEGLPVSIGPRVRLGRSNPTLLQALLIYRTAEGFSFDGEDLGYAIRAEQFVGGGRSARFGARYYSEIAPIERSGISDRENSLSTFVLHRDFRDEFRLRGWSVYGRFDRPGRPDQIMLEYREETHESVTPRSPWSLFDNDEAWRAQPLVGEGSLRSIAATYEWDTRNDDVDPSAGWLIRAHLEQGLGGTLVQPPFAPSQEEDAPVDGTPVRERFTLAELDVRRYARLSPYARVAARLLVTGSADGTPLPPQRQRTLGGEGSLPAFPLFAFDCGARRNAVFRDGNTFFPFYGCDRAALAQLEYQASFPFGRRISRAFGVSTDLGAVRWVAFVDAGRAWTEAAARNGRADEEFAANAGLGLRVGQFGAYWAVPLTDGAGGVNFFIRIGRRF